MEFNELIEIVRNYWQYPAGLAGWLLVQKVWAWCRQTPVIEKGSLEESVIRLLDDPAQPWVLGTIGEWLALPDGNRTHLKIWLGRHSSCLLSIFVNDEGRDLAPTMPRHAVRQIRQKGVLKRKILEEQALQKNLASARQTLQQL